MPIKPDVRVMALSVTVATAQVAPVMDIAPKIPLSSYDKMKQIQIQIQMK
jgi:hypothetical protein